jgi:hypothetical protein
VGDGSRIFLWLDVWHPDGCLLDKYGHRAVQDAWSSVGSKLSSILWNGDWFWPYARSDILVELQSKLPEVAIGGRDILVWNSGTGRYICADTWDSLRKKEPYVDWWKVVWHSVAALGTLFFYGWCSKMLQSLERGCVEGVILEIACVYFAGVELKIENIFSSNAGLVNVIGRT